MWTSIISLLEEKKTREPDRSLDFIKPKAWPLMSRCFGKPYFHKPAFYILHTGSVSGLLLLWASARTLIIPDIFDVVISARTAGRPQDDEQNVNDVFHHRTVLALTRPPSSVSQCSVLDMACGRLCIWHEAPDQWTLKSHLAIHFSI